MIVQVLIHKTAKDGTPLLDPRETHLDGFTQAAAPQEGGLDPVELVGRAEDQDPSRALAEPVDGSEEGAHDGRLIMGHPRMRLVTPPGQRVQLVDDHDRGVLFLQGSERLADHPLRFSAPHALELGCSDENAGASGLPRDRLTYHRLPGAGWAPEDRCSQAGRPPGVGEPCQMLLEASLELILAQDVLEPHCGDLAPANIEAKVLGPEDPIGAVEMKEAIHPIPLRGEVRLEVDTPSEASGTGPSEDLGEQRGGDRSSEPFLGRQLPGPG